MSKTFTHLGFSLIECIIVLVMMGILWHLTYPSYQGYLVRMHRTHAQLALFDLAYRMELYHHRMQDYTLATIGTGGLGDVLGTDQLFDDEYRLSIVMATPKHYQLQATPQGQQARNDQRCQSLQLDDQGKENIAPGPGGIPTGPSDHCWSNLP